MELRERVARWCAEEGLLQEEVADTTVAFQLKVWAPAFGGTPSADQTLLDVTLPAAPRDDRLLVSGGVRIDESLWDGMLDFDLDEFVQKLERRLEQMPPAHVVNYHSEVLRSITLIDEIYLDGLTKDRLIRSLHHVHKSIRYALWEIRPLLDSLTSSEAIARHSTPPPERYYQPASDSVMAGALGSPAEAPVQAKARYCPRCGQPVQAGRAFCTQCGGGLY